VRSYWSELVSRCWFGHELSIFECHWIPECKTISTGNPVWQPLTQQIRHHGGLIPPNNAPRPPKLNYAHYKLVEFLSYFRMSSSPEKRKSPLLKTFWRQFCTPVRKLLTKAVVWTSVNNLNVFKSFQMMLAATVRSAI